MGLTIRPARRSEAKPLIGLYGKSKSGKTLSALFLARGFVGKTGKIVMIESESGRGEAHIDTTIGASFVGGFDVIPLRDDYSPKMYGEAITLAEQSSADAVIIDSASHEWEGIGGVLHQAEMKRQDGAKSMQVWTQAKIDHQRHFLNRLLQTPIPLVIICMRAKEPMEEYVDDKGKKQMRRSGTLVPKQDHDILFEMFVNGYIDAEHKFHGNYTKPELADIIKSGEPITNATGEALARWARVDSPMALQAILSAIKLAENKTHLDMLAPHVKALPESEQKLASHAAKERIASLKSETSTRQ